MASGLLFPSLALLPVLHDLGQGEEDLGRMRQRFVALVQLPLVSLLVAEQVELFGLGSSAG
jgi:hypothetical protein